MKKILFLLTSCLISLNATADTMTIDIDKLKKKYARPATIPFPKDNQYSDAKYDLGKILYFDPRLSGTKVTSCATCHSASFNWGDNQAKAIGFGHKALGRKSPTILNLAWDTLLFWDGRAESLEQQALGPIGNPNEMHGDYDKIVTALGSMKEYRERFKQAFPEDGGKITKENLAKAIATFERKVVSGEAPFDKWIKGDESAMSEQAKKGFVLYNTKAKCNKCHLGWRMTDGSFHDIGLKSKDIGRGKYDHDIEAMKYAFKTPGLRNIDQRAPYMHDGSIKTLKEVINHYNDGFINRPSLSANMSKLSLTEEEKADLLAFLHTLTSKDEPVTVPVLPVEDQ